MYQAVMSSWNSEQQRESVGSPQVVAWARQSGTGLHVYQLSFLSLISQQWETGPRIQTFSSVTRLLQALGGEGDSMVSDLMSQLRRLHGKVSNQEKLVIVIDKLRVAQRSLCVTELRWEGQKLTSMYKLAAKGSECGPEDKATDRDIFLPMLHCMIQGRTTLYYLCTKS